MKDLKKKYGPINLAGIKNISIKKRRNLVKLKQFASAVELGEFAAFMESLPKVLAGNHFRSVVDAMVKAIGKKHQVVVAIGAHVIKCGLSPIITDLVKRGIITAVAMNSAAAIHDYEISLIGETSEDVSESLKDGSFGMARETVNAFQMAAAAGTTTEGDSEYKMGLGRALGTKITKDKNKYNEFSILAACAKLNIPVTVHTAIGTDTIHMHPNISPAHLGESSHIDFRILCSVVAGLEGGVWVNIGSAVIMPEVFLKALTVVRNLGHKVDDFTAVNMDMVQHYRPLTNIIKRPGKHGYAITGHHEIMLPLLRACILSKLQEKHS
ncbi:MAG: hypothetical protein MRK02_14990 [Candidatus Scalindua sp.]|nr:hypothetical protein [Candidatus Scalindua sp.]